MSTTTPTNLPLGWIAPEFALTDVLNRHFSWDKLGSFPGLLIIFMNQANPVAKYVWPALTSLYEDFKHQVAFMAINPLADDRNRPESQSAMLQTVQEYQLDFPYLLDPNQQVAYSYQVNNLPDFYLF